MRTTFILGVIIVLMMMTPTKGKAEDKSSMIQNTERLYVGFTIRSSHSKDGCEGDRGFCFYIVWTRTMDMPVKDKNFAIAEVSLAKDGNLKFNILSDNSNDGKEFDPVFRIFRDVELPGDLANALGREKIVMAKGDYAVNMSKSQYGTVNVKLR